MRNSGRRPGSNRISHALPACGVAIYLRLSKARMTPWQEGCVIIRFWHAGCRGECLYVHTRTMSLALIGTVDFVLALARHIRQYTWHGDRWRSFFYRKSFEAKPGTLFVRARPRSQVLERSWVLHREVLQLAFELYCQSWRQKILFISSLPSPSTKRRTDQLLRHTLNSHAGPDL